MMARAPPIYVILFKASAEATLTIAANKRHLGARVGNTSVLHTWGSAMTHHPRVHLIVPGGGLSSDSERWIACRPNFLLPVRLLLRLFSRRVIELRLAAHSAKLEAGKVWIPRKAPWLDGFMDELLAFPHAKHDDQVDAFSQFLTWADYKMRKNYWVYDS